MLDTLVNELYAEPPRVPLHHYTSLDGMMGIVASKVLWATELRYLNDAAELQHFGSLLEVRVQKLASFVEEPFEREALEQFGKWVNYRFQDGPMLFATSLTENGNLLSQWRGYCPHGRGVSLGFDAGFFKMVVSAAGYSMGRCIYDYPKQDEICAKVITCVLDLCKEKGPGHSAHTSQSLWPLFTQVEGSILKIAAVMKHPSFKEEEEWRCVSELVNNFREEEIFYRPAATMLIPYKKLPLPAINDALAVQTVFVGPTPTPNLSISSIGKYLSRHANSSHQRFIIASGIPYRG